MNVIPLSCFRGKQITGLLSVEPLIDVREAALKTDQWQDFVASYQVVCDAWQEVEDIAHFLFRKGHLDLGLLYAWMESAIAEGLSDMRIRCIDFPEFPSLLGATIPVAELEIDLGDVGRAAVKKLVDENQLALHPIRMAKCATRIELRLLA